jgi:hypothetical protein
MRFIVMVKADANSEAGKLPSQAVLSAMGAFNQEMTNAGVMLAGEGLKASAKGFLVQKAGKKVTVVDGPFAEAKELVGGFWLLSTRTKAEAIDWIKRAPFQEGNVELRQLYELSDFPVDESEKAAGWREQEQAFRDGADAAATGSGPPPVARKPGTTRYMVMLRADRATERGTLPGPEALARMGALMDEMVKAGAVLGGEGLKPSASGARIHFQGDKRTVIDGPFSETKEMIAGYTLIQVKTREEAISFAKRWLDIHTDVSGLDEGQLEIRPLFELEDFPVSP